MPLDQNPILDILYRTTARYLAVRPDAILVDNRPAKTLLVRILAHGAARTCYRARRPCCRSLDSLHSTGGKPCQTCKDLEDCTSQVRLHLLLDRRPYLLLLAYSSARNFLLYLASLGERAPQLRDLDTRITVANRGSWGELRFEEAHA
jgi:hypothetical protein